MAPDKEKRTSASQWVEREAQKHGGEKQKRREAGKKLNLAAMVANDVAFEVAGNVALDVTTELLVISARLEELAKKIGA